MPGSQTSALQPAHYLRRVYLFILGCNEHAADAHKLQTGSSNLLSGEIPVNKADSQEECVRDKLIFLHTTPH